MANNKLMEYPMDRSGGTQDKTGPIKQEIQKTPARTKQLIFGGGEPNEHSWPQEIPARVEPPTKVSDTPPVHSKQMSLRTPEGNMPCNNRGVYKATRTLTPNGEYIKSASSNIYKGK